MSPDEPPGAFPTHFATRGPYPLRHGNQAIAWIDGIPFHARLAAAFRAAHKHIWAIVSFIQPTFRFPDGTSWWDLLDECQARGVDVRVLYWRNPRFSSTAHVFLGGPAERAFLAARAAAWAGRWDSSGDDPTHCHHQKSYVVDAGEPDAIAFIGGMVPSASTLAHPGHHHGHHKHDAFVELRGPVVADAEHNFVQRWNHAHRDPAAPPWPDETRANPLPHPTRVPPPCGAVPVQLARTLRPHSYPSTPPTPFDPTAGESTILEQLRGAFAAARRTIYLENQHPGQFELLEQLAAALARGVQVVMVVPGEPMPAIYRASAEVAALPPDRLDTHRYGPTFRGLAALAAHPGFTLVALARSDPDGPTWSHREIYTHAKLCIVDGAWASIGSANLVDLSLDRDHTELNAAIWGRETCTPWLRTLIAEHTDLDADDDLAALTAIATHARASRASLLAGGPILAGCYALDAARYAQDPPLTRP